MKKINKRKIVMLIILIVLIIVELKAFTGSRDGVKRVLNNYKNKDFNKLDKDQVKFYNDMKTSYKNLNETVKVFEKEKNRRKL